MSHAYYRSGRSLWSLWSLLTVAAAGFALLAAGIYLDSNRYMGLGTGVFTLGGIGYLFVQFWKVGTQGPPGLRRAVPAATLVGVTPVAAKAPAAPMDHADEDLIEFELVGEKPAPTTLEVPPAFHLESRADASPPEPSAVFPWLVKEASGKSETYVPATERRTEIVQGLPLLSSIFSAEPAAPTEAEAPRTGRTRGQCGGCGTMLWAPTQRPLRLRCPKCGHVRTLTE